MTEPLLPEQLVEKWKGSIEVVHQWTNAFFIGRNNAYGECARELEAALRVQPPQASGKLEDLVQVRKQTTNGVVTGAVVEVAGVKVSSWSVLENDLTGPEDHANRLRAVLRAGAPTDRNAPSELLDEVLNVIGRLYNVYPPIGLMEGFNALASVETAVHELKTARFPLAAKPGNAASSELQDCDLCHMSPMITEQENGYHVSKITGSRFKCVANSAKPGNVAPGGRPLSAHIEHNPEPWSQIVYVVAGTHSQIAFFNRESAERWKAERTEPDKYAIHEFVRASKPGNVAPTDRNAPSECKCDPEVGWLCQAHAIQRDEYMKRKKLRTGLDDGPENSICMCGNSRGLACPIHREAAKPGNVAEKEKP